MAVLLLMGSPVQIDLWWCVVGFGVSCTAIWPLLNLGLAKYLATLSLSFFSELLGKFLSLYPLHVVNLSLADSPGNCLM